MCSSCCYEALAHMGACHGCQCLLTCHIVWTPAGEQVAFVGIPDETARKLPFPGAVALSNMWQYLREVGAFLRSLSTIAASSALT